MCRPREISGQFGEPEVVPECAHEVQRLCADLSRFAKTIDVKRQLTSEEPKTTTVELEIGSEHHLRLIARNRARRAKFFNSHLFADPAWDMLLDLYRAKLAKERVSVTSVCLASGVAPTTALRWLKTLEAENLIVRSKDPVDCRRVFVELTAQAEAKMRGYLMAAQDKLFA